MGDPDELFIKGEKKIKSFDFFGIFSDKYHDALEYFKKAGNLYKLNKDFEKAGESYIRCAHCCERLDAIYDQVEYYEKGANCYKSIDNDKYVMYMCMVIDILQDRCDSFKRVANKHQELAKFHQNKELYRKSIYHYNQAIRYFEIDKESKFTQNKVVECKKNIGIANAILGEYTHAIDILEDIIEESNKNNSTPYRSIILTPIVFGLGLCYLIRRNFRKIDRLLNEYFTGIIETSKEAKKLRDLYRASVGNSNITSGTDSICYENWQKVLIDRVSGNLDQAVEESSDSDYFT